MTGSLSLCIWEALSVDVPRCAREVEEVTGQKLGMIVSMLAQLSRRGVVVRVERGRYVRGMDPRGLERRRVAWATVAEGRRLDSKLRGEARRDACRGLVRLELERRLGQSAPELARRVGCSPALMKSVLAGMVANGEVVIEGERQSRYLLASRP